MASRRSLIAGLPLVAMGMTSITQASDSLDYAPAIDSEPVEEFTLIDAESFEPFGPSAADYLWEDASPLYGKTFRIKCEMVRYYPKRSGEGYIVPFSQEIYPALILAKAAGKNFFIATGENPRDYRKFNGLQVQAYYRGGYAFWGTYEVGRDTGFTVTEVNALPLIAAIEMVGV